MSIELYNSMSPSANSMINEDGSITTLSGEAIPLDAVARFKSYSPKANKYLMPDGSIKTLHEVLGLANLEEQIQNCLDSNVYDQNKFIVALRHKLKKANESVCLQILGDSTGNDPNEWFQLTLEKIAEKYTNFTTYSRDWSDTTQSYSGLHYNISTGTEGEAYGLFDNGYCSLENENPLKITGDIDIFAKMNSVDYKGLANQVIFSKIGATGTRGYQFSILADTGKLFFWWSPDGTTLLSATSTIAPPSSNNTDRWFGVTLDVDNDDGGHTVRFYTSYNGFVRTQFGDNVVGVDVTSIYPSPATSYIGSRGGVSDKFNGKIYKVFIKDGIDGTVVASPNFGLAFPSVIESFKDAEENQWNVMDGLSVANGSPAILGLNGSKAGQVMAYSTDPTRFEKQVTISPDLIFINYGHNEGTKIEYQSEYEGLCNQILTKFQNAGVVCTAQNEKLPPATNIEQHSIRNSQIARLSAKNRYGLIDTYTAFHVRDDLVDLIKVMDGIHPTELGSQVWAEEVAKFIGLLFI